jgi:hypothetical protein
MRLWTRDKDGLCPIDACRSIQAIGQAGARVSVHNSAPFASRSAAASWWRVLRGLRVQNLGLPLATALRQRLHPVPRAMGRDKKEAVTVYQGKKNKGKVHVGFDTSKRM